MEHIDVKQTLSGGFKAPADSLLLNGEESSKNDDLFGHLIAKSWRAKVDDLEIDFLKEGWSEDTLEDGLIAGVVKSDTAKSGKDWVINVVRLMVWFSIHVILIIYIRYGVLPSLKV